MKADVYNAQGKKTGSAELPESVFDVRWNDALMHQVVTSMQDNARTSVAHTKNRAEVRGGGRKPWAQKGTGRARHSSIRSPIWRGGGVTHGPRKEKIYTRVIPKGMRVKALAMALSRKLRDGEVVFVDTFAIDVPKTSVARKVLVSLANAVGMKKLSEKHKNAALVALADPREAVAKSFRNIGNVELRAVRDLNPVSILRNSCIVIENPDASIAILLHRIGAKPGTAVLKAETKTKKPARKSAKATLTATRVQQKGDQ